MSGVSYGAFLGMALTGTALILAFIAMLLARRSPETYIARIFLERARIKGLSKSYSQDSS